MNELLIIGGLIAAGLYLTKKQDNKGQTSIFPLKKGSANALVKNLQQALLNKGNDVAQLVLAGGGVTGQFNLQTQKALEVAGYPTVVTETDYRVIVGSTGETRNIAYVNNIDGAPVFEEIAQGTMPGYGYGRNELARFPVKTYLGTSTGKYAHGMLEIVTNINTNQVKFWVPTNTIALVSESEYAKLKRTTILPKSEALKRKFLNL